VYKDVLAFYFEVDKIHHKRFVTLGMIENEFKASTTGIMSSFSDHLQILSQQIAVDTYSETQLISSRQVDDISKLIFQLTWRG
jgi:hypothetical protein